MKFYVSGKATAEEAEFPYNSDRTVCPFHVP